MSSRRSTSSAVKAFHQHFLGDKGCWLSIWIVVNPLTLLSSVSIILKNSTCLQQGIVRIRMRFDVNKGNAHVYISLGNISKTTRDDFHSGCQNIGLLRTEHKFLVSKGTVVQVSGGGSEKWLFGFIKRVDKGRITSLKIWKGYVLSVSPSSERILRTGLTLAIKSYQFKIMVLVGCII